MSEKKESKKEKSHRRWLTRFWLIIFGLAFFLLLVLFTIFVIWLVLRPTKPTFSLQDASVTFFNASGELPNTISIGIQVTVSTRNPNSRIGIYFDELDVRAAYMSQQITPAIAIPPAYLGHKDVLLISPVLSGAGVPIAPFLAESLAQDKCEGLLMLDVKFYGRVRWKVGRWTSGKYRLAVNCPAYLSFFGDRASSAGGCYPSPVIRFRSPSACSVDV